MSCRVPAAHQPTNELFRNVNFMVCIDNASKRQAFTTHCIAWTWWSSLIFIEIDSIKNRDEMIDENDVENCVAHGFSNADI